MMRVTKSTIYFGEHLGWRHSLQESLNFGVLSGKPNPKKDKPDSNPIFPARLSVKFTIMTELIFGNTSRKMILQFGVPNVLDA